MWPMKRLTILTILALLTTLAMAQTASNPSVTAAKAIFTPPLIWGGATGAGQPFGDNVSLNKAGAAKDGSVQTNSSEGTCELSAPYPTAANIDSISANWTFTGSVTMEVTATGKTEDYKPITNGVPLAKGQFTPGSKLKWRATLTPNSTLTEVRIAYTDLSGVAGTMGSPVISGFRARKIITVKGSPDDSLYNFQIPITVGESQKAAGCDIYLDSSSLSNLIDIRFTAADGETPIAYWRESVTGIKPNRIATFWIRIPEVPKGAELPLYIYYGKEKADDLSDATKVFDLFDDFTGPLDNKKWKVFLAAKTSSVSVVNSILEINNARITAPDYNFAGGIIEYRAKLTAVGAVTGIISAGSTGYDDLAASSSLEASSGHCIMIGSKVLANYPSTISLDTYYDYRAMSDGSNITFQRYSDGWGNIPQAEVKYPIGTNQPGKPVGMSAGIGGTGVYFDWIRVRKFAATPPQIDRDRTAKGVEEAANLPTFSNVTLADDGTVTLVEKVTEGEYISRLISAPFEVRAITTSWTALGEGSVAVEVSTNEPSAFTAGWQNGIAKYASKKDFVKGRQLRWKADFKGQGSNLKTFSFSFQPGIINVIIPNGGETVAPGAQYNIIWETEGYDPSSNMDLSYSLDGGTTFQPIASKVANTGGYSWTVPQTESSKAIIMVADSLDKTVYGVSSACFAISAAAKEAAKTQNAQVQATTATQPQTPETVTVKSDLSKTGSKNMYDLLVIRISPAEAKKRPAGDYEDGDIVAVMPTGTIWGAEEVKNFLIVRAYLTEDQAKELTSPKATAAGADENGKLRQNITKIRRYKVNLGKKELADREAQTKRGYLGGAALSDLSTVIDKNVSE